MESKLLANWEEFIAQLMLGWYFDTEGNQVVLTTFKEFLEEKNLIDPFLEDVNLKYQDNHQQLKYDSNCAFPTDLVSCFIEWDGKETDWSAINVEWQDILKDRDKD